MKALVTGATGFTGSHVLQQLLEAGVQVRCFVRASSDTRRIPVRQVELAEGDLNDRNSLLTALNGVDTLVNIASLGFGHAPGIVSAALAAGVSRGLFISTTAVFTSLNAPSKTTRLAAEEAIKRSGLTYTILRPTMIYGTPGDRNIWQLIQYLRRWHIIPVFGNGEHLQQPVYVGDVASAVVKALLSDNTLNKAYNISGAAPLTFNQVIDTICALLGRRVYKVHLPAKPVIASIAALGHLPVRMPIKAEQIQRLNENKAFDHSEASRDFGYRPLLFREGVSKEIQFLGIRTT